uniref:DUF3338 domain-containing protein n=1 Tax=Anopheles christyi TaxID=43041 RepID=A0A182JZJ8_9DIPT
MGTVVMDAKHATDGLLGSPQQQQQQTGKEAMAGTNTGTPVSGKDKSPASLKYEQLKVRKQELEKRLNEKYSQLQQIKREEAQLIGMYPSDFSCGIGPSSSSDGVNGTAGVGSGGTGTGNGTAPTLRRKIGTSFKLPENLLNNKEDDINKLLLEKQIQQQISEASLRLANDSGQPKSVRRTHKQNYEMAQQKLLAINQNLSVLKKRQQQKEQQLQQQQQQQQQLKDQQQAQQANEAHRPTSRDDIDLHKTAQLSMLRHRARTDSFPGIATNYDSVSAGSGATEQSLKISPLSGSGSIASGGSGAQQAHPHLHPHHHHHQIGPGPARMNRLIQQQIGVNNYSPPGAGNSTTTPGYVLSPTSVGASPGGNGTGQAFVYDAKVISRLQGGVGGGGTGVNNNPRSPQSAVPSASYGHMINDQNYCPNTMAATGQSVPPSTVGPGYDYHTQPEQSVVPSVPAGLGGYWMTLENGEKVWCSVDNRQFSSLDRKQQCGGSMKLSRTSTKLNGNKPSGPFSAITPAVKSSSLGNFQEYIGNASSLDENEMMTVQPDAISVTSGSSEHKKREKVWRETSLDSPVVKHKALPPIPTSSAGQMSPSSIGSGHLMHSPHGSMVPQSPPYIPPMGSNPTTAPLHINTNVSGYGAGPCSPLLLSPQQMRYYQQRQQQLLEQQRQRIKHQQQQQQQHQQHQRLMMEEQQKQQFLASSKQHESMGQSPQSPMGSTGGTSSTATTGEPYSTYSYQQTQLDPQSVPPYHSRHQHPPPPPLPPPNQHHYHHSQQLLQNRLQLSPSVPSSQPQHLDLLPQSYSQQLSDGGPVTSHHQSHSLGHHHHHRGGGGQLVHTDPGNYYPHGAVHLANTLSSRHPDLVISPTLSQASSHTLTSPTATTVVQALPVVGGAEENEFSGSSSPTPSSGKGPAQPPSDIQMESPKNMTVVQQGKIMPYKEVTKPFEMSDFYKYSTKYRQKQQQKQQQQQPQIQQQPSPSEVVGNDSEAGGDGIHKGIYQPPNRSICQPLVNNYN